MPFAAPVITKIATELAGVQDDLAVWAKQKDHTFFLPADALTLWSYQEIISWTYQENFQDYAKKEFADGADPFLIAHALAYGHTVVTHERLINIGQRNKIKIPAVCQQFSVPCITVFELLKSTGAKFDLR